MPPGNNIRNETEISRRITGVTKTSFGISRYVYVCISIPSLDSKHIFLFSKQPLAYEVTHRVVATSEKS